MRTSSPFSTISYNTIPFLKAKLQELMQLGKIEFYSFISHLPEEDEKKDHIHLFVIPNGLYDTQSFIDYLIEPDKDITKPPLKCIRCVHSKFSDWYLYGIHDIDYLATKCESRKYHYNKEDFVVADYDYFNELIHSCDFSKYKAFSKFRESVKSGVSFKELFEKGFIPVQQIRQYERAYYLMKNKDEENTTYRSYHSGHEFIDTVTGEIVHESRLRPLVSKKDREVNKQLTLSDEMTPFDDK